MRLLAEFDDETTAQRLGDYFVTQSIDNEVESDDGVWNLWIKDDDQLDEANTVYHRFLRDPQADEFTNCQAEAKKRREKLRKEGERYHRRLRDGRLATAQTASAPGPVTWTIVGLCVLVGAFTGFSDPFKTMEALFISATPPQVAFLPEVRQGEVWRLITPAILHGDILHLAFNMYWMLFFGAAVESKSGSRFLAGLCFLIALGSNFAQYILVNHMFVGLSGVVYGLFGFVWVMSRRAPMTGYRLDQGTATILMIFFFIGFLGFLGVANYVHAGGLILGATTGFIESARKR